MDNRDYRDGRNFNDGRDFRDNNREHRERRDFRDRDGRKSGDELYSQAIPAGKRRYFFDVKATRGGDKYITITESRRLFDNRTGEFYFDKNKMFLYKEDFEKFQKGLENAFSFIETGIVPPPVVTEDELHDQPADDNKFDSAIEDINLNF